MISLKNIKNDQMPTINVITRTSNRPNFFHQCHQSIVDQTYSSSAIHNYVTFDDEKDLDGYIQKYENLIIMEMFREQRKNQSHFPYHDYLNEVIEYISKEQPGWILILDDDNVFAKNNSLEILGKQIIKDGRNPNKFYIWKCKHGNRIVPNDVNFNMVPKPGDLHISCFAFHSSQFALAKFEAKKGAEYQVVNMLFNKLNTIWIPEILTQTQGSGNGNRQDYQIEVIGGDISVGAGTGASAGTKKISINLKRDSEQTHSKEIKQITSENDISNTQIQKQKNNKNQSHVKEISIDEYFQKDLVNIRQEKDGNLSRENFILQNAIDPESDEENNFESHCDAQNDGNNSDEEIITSNEINATHQNETKKNFYGESSYITRRKNSQKQSDQGSIFDKTLSHEFVDKLENLLSNGKKIYILDENNMQKLSKCMYDAMACIELEDRLVNLLEQNYLEKKASELQHKLAQIESVRISSNNQSQSIPIAQNQKKKEINSIMDNIGEILGQSPSVKPHNNGRFIDRFYIITNQTNQNSALDRNKKILEQSHCDYEILITKDMNLYGYQNQIKEALSSAKKNNYQKIAIINGNSLLNNKFADLFNKQVDKIKSDCNLWFFGDVRETMGREILATRFDLSDYLFLYDDIVKAKLTTLEKAQIHWKSYGHKEGRYACIEAINGHASSTNNNYGFAISNNLYDHLIELLNKQTSRNCQNVICELIPNFLDKKTIWRSFPDLIIPQFPNPKNDAKNSQIAVKNGWYYNFFK